MRVDADAQWHPIATSLDLPHRHVFQGKLLGRELAVWRADDDFVNVWENRCLHRGVRLSIGSNSGMELTCRYHGWRYSNRSAGCTYIPAHPADAPARTISNRTFLAMERYGLVWSGEAPIGAPPSIDILDAGRPFVLRNLPVNSSAEVAIEALLGHRFEPTQMVAEPEASTADPRITMQVEQLNTHTLALTATGLSEARSATSTVVCFVQPVDEAHSVIRSVLSEAPDDADKIEVWRHHARRLAETVSMAEKTFASQPAPRPMAAALDEVPVELSVMPEQVPNRSAGLRVRVARKWTTATDVVAYEFVSIADPLPTFHAGSHLDVHLPNGLIRQYSITNGPGATASYRIGVKRVPHSSGGSAALHDIVHEGDVLAISEPRNGFPLRRDATSTILIAGGIGVTPLLAMAQALHPMGLEYQLHYFVRSRDHLAFAEVLEVLGDAVVTHIGLSPDETHAELQDLLKAPASAHQIYVCGPAPMLEATRSIAGDAGWPDDAVHFEYFENPTELDDSSEFEIALARSAATLRVQSGQSILEVLRGHGLSVPSSCEQGACGTCGVTVIEGEIDHQDVHLSATERESGDTMMSCVSRSSSARLVLDI